MIGIGPEDPVEGAKWYNQEADEFLKFINGKWVAVGCDVCGTAKDLRSAAPLMAKPGAETLVCRPCFRAWYASGEVTREGILRERLREVEGK